MKKFRLLIISFIVGVYTIGCSKTNEVETQQNDEKIKVYTTVFPIYDFTRNIGKDKIDLNYIVSPGTEPHEYEITPKLMKDIQNSDLLIKNGLDMDGFADKIESESESLTIKVATEGIEARSYEEHDNTIEKDHHTEHNHDNEDEKTDEHNHGEYDPHVWLDIDLAKKQCENIKNALIEVDSKNTEYYTKNYEEYIIKLDKLDKKYDETMKSKENKNIIVSHDAYGYLCDKYSLKQISVTGISPNQEPSLSKISELSKFAKVNNIGYVLFDGLVNPRVAQTIADEAKINTEVLYSLDNIIKSDFDNNEDYISLMEKNLETLKLVLK